MKLGLARSLLAGLACAPALAACSTLEPAQLKASPPQIAVPAARGASVLAASHEEPLSRFNANGMAFEVDLDAFSEELARLLGESLRGAGVAGSERREIRVRVDYLDFMYQGPCLVDYRVSLGGAPYFGLQSQFESANFTTACRRALELAVKQIASDPRTRAYLNGGAE